MTVRQENERKTNAKKNKLKKITVQQFESKENIFKNDKIPNIIIANSNSNICFDFLSKLKYFLFILSSESAMTQSDELYTQKVREFESFMKNHADLPDVSSSSLEIISHCADAYWILCNIYYTRDWSSEIGFAYMQKSLQLFLHCNQMTNGQYNRYLA